MPTLTKLYSMKEAALHNTPEDCWVVIDGKVAPPSRSLLPSCLLLCVYTVSVGRHVR
jgi:hypothetical protein